MCELYRVLYMYLCTSTNILVTSSLAFCTTLVSLCVLRYDFSQDASPPSPLLYKPPDIILCFIIPCIWLLVNLVHTVGLENLVMQSTNLSTSLQHQRNVAIGSVLRQLMFCLMYHQLLVQVLDISYTHHPICFLPQVLRNFYYHPFELLWEG